jgi:hypothetical protein
MAKNVLVVGMPRSGTSMTAGIFARAGYFVTDEPDVDLRPGDPGNPDGYWEAEGLIERNVEVFREAGYEGHNTWLFDPIEPEVARRIHSVRPLEGHAEFIERFEENAPWIWKDPRLSYTLGYWWQLLDPENTCVVLTKRDPEAIYRSFLRLGWREPSNEARDDVYTRVEDHMAAATEAIRQFDIPHAVVEYERVADNSERIAEAISALCSIAVGASDLGFEQRFDHSSGRGRVTTLLERFVHSLPAAVRNLLKKAVPNAMIRAVFPERGPSS